MGHSKQQQPGIEETILAYETPSGIVDVKEASEKFKWQ